MKNTNKYKFISPDRLSKIFRKDKHTLDRFLSALLASPSNTTIKTELFEIIKVSETEFKIVNEVNEVRLHRLLTEQIEEVVEVGSNAL